MKRRLSLIIVVLLVLSFSTNVSAVSNLIRINVDGKTLTFDVNPIIQNDRTLVPFRAIFESLGSKDIEWNQNKNEVSGSLDTTKITLTIDSKIAIINDRIVNLDTPPIIKEGRTLVPLRFVSEALGAHVEWNSLSRTINVKSESYINKVINMSLGISLKMYMDVNELIKIMGNPDRIDESGRYYKWYIYNSDIENYIQIGIYDNIIVAFATNSSKWSINDSIYVRQSKTNISKKYAINPTNINQDVSLVNVNDNYLHAFWDTINDNILSSILLEDKYSYNDYKYSDKTYVDFAREMFDLTNVLRLRNGLNILKWSDNLADMAEYHSSDMAKNNYFSHESKNGDTVADRAERFIGTKYGVGENIAGGYFTPMHALEGLYNSKGHRQNILYDYNYLGIGVKNGEMIYYTQSFQKIYR